MATGAEKRSPGTLAIIGTFALVCPPATVFADLALTALGEIAMQQFPSLQYREVVWFSLLYGIPFGYLVLVWPAAIAGLIVARWQAVKGPAPLWLPLLFGVVAAGAFVLWLGAGNRAGQNTGSPLLGEALTAGTAFAIALMIAWAIVRKWQAPAPATAPRP